MRGSLAPYAARPESSRGRRVYEPAPPHRTEFQRDRDRIIHSSAFRRLEYKTQVFVNHEGDLFRTRLTHSLEVAQIARTIARALRLNEDLCEAIALAHDLGHTPFGHAGQDALNACMRPYGGFEHNAQSLRVVDELESKYASFRGLNLLFETREGILKHCSAKRARTLGDIGERFLQRRQPSLEAQLTNLADEVAYNNHDVDDGLRAGLITFEQLREVPLFRRHHDLVLKAYPRATRRQQRHETIRRMISTLISDLVGETRRRLQKAAPRKIDQVRALNRPLVGYSAAMAQESLTLKQFLNRKLYRHPKVVKMSQQSQRVIGRLFALYMKKPRLIPAEFVQDSPNPTELPRLVADYIAGMTDRFALGEHARV
ncbi:MAG: deoxyguanosinetriphosphate triphosphohydrolase [Pseudomonadota bacterium]